MAKGKALEVLRRWLAHIRRSTRLCQRPPQPSNRNQQRDALGASSAGSAASRYLENMLLNKSPAVCQPISMSIAADFEKVHISRVRFSCVGSRAYLFFSAPSSLGTLLQTPMPRMRRSSRCKRASCSRSVPPSFPKHDSRVQVQVVQAGSATQGHNVLVTAQLALQQFAFLQATVGDVEGTQPWAVQMEARAKWDAWNSVKGMAKEEAMKQYIDIVTKGDANWRVSCVCSTWQFKMPQIHALTRLLLIATKICECINSQLVVVCFCWLGCAQVVNKLFL